MAFTFYRSDSLPVDPQQRHKNCMYLIKSPTKTDFDIVMVDGSGVAHTHFNEDRFKRLFDYYSRSTGDFFVVNNIEERDALSLTKNSLVFVVDASGDPVVPEGEALYFFSTAMQKHIRIYQEKKRPETLDWTLLVNGPTSTPLAIDAAVANSHTHTNPEVLESLGVQDGLLTHNGTLVSNVVYKDSNW